MANLCGIAGITLRFISAYGPDKNRRFQTGRHRKFPRPRTETCVDTFAIWVKTLKNTTDDEPLSQAGDN